MLEERHITLTSTALGAVATTEITPSVHGKLVKVEIENGLTTLQPDNNWTLTVTLGSAAGPSYEVLFNDATVAQTNTSKIVYYPVVANAIASDGSASILTETSSDIFQKTVFVSASAMGDSNQAKVKLIFEDV